MKTNGSDIGENVAVLIALSMVLGFTKWAVGKVIELSSQPALQLQVLTPEPPKQIHAVALTIRH